MTVVSINETVSTIQEQLYQQYSQALLAWDQDPMSDKLAQAARNIGDAWKAALSALPVSSLPHCTDITSKD